tara:strand:- start:162 stop:683 length:522 start_codon:yes stop_codon:yes gene_type:complete
MVDGKVTKMKSSWIVVQTKLNNENKALINLVRQGFEVFYPKILKPVKIFNKFKRIIKPLFPGYIFVNLDTNKNWFRINSTFGVNRIIKFGEKMTFLPIDFIESLQNKCDEKNIIQQNHKIKSGDRVRIVGKSLFNLEGIFQESIDSNRVLILLEILKTKIKTTIKKGNIEIID